ncbi:high affinity choline transporter 1 [Nocardiopsis aegyptia]|uniref:SSS family solute:Na+ symporter n=1 Tax=Nocardiopsis aegyptia TaxID=220378 RepID=A0A7Z0JBI0_9ACTN|nr:sodium:solute symporter family protein [Nocardiopsis aegyptia]NYJ35464.1 SSS family solute:Na+ symporter [Nocardiopsis aegyptia]
MIILGVGTAVLCVVTLGLLVARKVGGDADNYLLAGRSLGLPLVAVALAAQAVDSNATAGNTDLAFEFGFWAGASLPVGLALCLLITGVFFAKPMNRMKLVTLPDYYRLRFGRGIEVTASLIMIACFAILLAGNLVAVGLMLEHFTGLSYTAGVLVVVGLILTYTIAGGMYSDVYTALAQTVLTLVAVAALTTWMALTHGLSIPEGMGPLDLGQLTDPAQGAPVNLATLLALGIGDIIAIDFMQRIFAARSPRTAQRACFAGAGITLAVGVPFSLVALSSVSVLGDDVDGPVLFALLDGTAPALLAVLVLSGLVTASFTTASGVILSTAAVVVRNIRGRRRGTDLSSAQVLRFTRYTMVPMALLGVVFALRVPQTGILLTLAFDLMLAGLAVPFVLGMAWRRGGAAAATAALVVGLGSRLAMFVLTPTVYGADNDLLYLSGGPAVPDLDGWSTMIAAGASLTAYTVVALLRPAVPAAATDPEPTAPVVEEAEYASKAGA